MQPACFRISVNLRNVPLTSEYFTDREMSFGSYQEALTERMRHETACMQWACLPETSVQGDEAVSTSLSRVRDRQACLQLLHGMLRRILCSLRAPVAIKDCQQVAVAAAAHTLLDDVPVLHPVFTT